MPKFETVPLDELKKASEISTRTREKIKPYLSYLEKLSPETGGKLVCEKGENINLVRNNLKKAATVAGKDIETRRSGNVILFYLSDGKRRGRRKKG